MVPPDPKFSFPTCTCATSANPQEVSPDAGLPFLFAFHLSLELLLYILFSMGVFVSLLSCVYTVPLRDRHSCERQQMITFHTN